MSGACQIRDESGDRVPLVPNELQSQLWGIMYRQARAGKPVRVIVLKARQHGISTLVQAAGYFLTRYRSHRQAATIAHEEVSTNQIFRITHRIYSHDPRRVARLKGCSRTELAYRHDSKL